MKLTDYQIQILQSFTKDYFVEHYDLQIELVDHMANDIEEIWKESPKISFEEAKEMSFEKFGGSSGFFKIVEQKKKQLKKKYMRILWSFVKEWFQFPKILLTIVFIFLIYISLQYDFGSILIAVLLLVLLGLELYFRERLKRQAEKKFKKEHRKWMLEDVIFNMIPEMMPPFQVSNFVYLFLYIGTDIQNYSWIDMFFAIVFALSIICSFIIYQVIPKKVEELLRAHYPEYKIQ